MKTNKYDRIRSAIKSKRNKPETISYTSKISGHGLFPDERYFGGSEYNHLCEIFLFLYSNKGFSELYSPQTKEKLFKSRPELIPTFNKFFRVTELVWHGIAFEFKQEFRKYLKLKYLELEITKRHSNYTNNWNDILRLAGGNRHRAVSILYGSRCRDEWSLSLVKKKKIDKLSLPSKEMSLWYDDVRRTNN